MKRILAFFLFLIMLVSQSSVCLARNISTYEILLNMDPALIERFREGGLEDAMIQDFMGVLDEEADKLQKPEDRETLESYFLSLLLLYVFQQEQYAPVMVAFDRSFQEEIVFIGETGRLPESLEIFFLSVMGDNLLYVPPEENAGEDAPVEDLPEETPTLTPTPSPTPTPPFSDLTDYEWAIPHIQKLYDRDLVNGYPDGTFGPGRYVSRAELTHMVAKAFLDTTYYYDVSRYPDVAETDWYYRDLLTAEYFSLFQWIYDGEFLPDIPVTRQELCAVVYRAYRRSEGQMPKREAGVDFLDFAQIASYAYDPILQLQQAGCIKGYHDGYFYPQKLATRAETAKVIALALQLD